MSNYYAVPTGTNLPGTVNTSHDLTGHKGTSALCVGSSFASSVHETHFAYPVQESIPPMPENDPPPLPPPRITTDGPPLPPRMEVRLQLILD